MMIRASSWREKYLRIKHFPQEVWPTPVQRIRRAVLNSRVPTTSEECSQPRPDSSEFADFSADPPSRHDSILRHAFMSELLRCKGLFIAPAAPAAQRRVFLVLEETPPNHKSLIRGKIQNWIMDQLKSQPVQWPKTRPVFLHWRNTHLRTQTSDSAENSAQQGVLLNSEHTPSLPKSGDIILTPVFALADKTAIDSKEVEPTDQILLQWWNTPLKSQGMCSSLEHTHGYIHLWIHRLSSLPVGLKRQ